MGWIRVSDDFYDNDKMFAAGSIGRDLYWHGMAFCNRNLTDGLIPKGRALTLVDFTDAAVLTGFGGVDGQECAPIAVERLLEAGLWHGHGHECPACPQPGPRHYVVHDYLKYQPSRLQVEEKAESTRERVAAWRAAQKNGNDVSNSVTNDVRTRPVTPSVQHTPTPTPTPNTSSLVTSRGEGYVSNARGPRPHCSKHPENTDDEQCRPCMKRRIWDEAEEADALAAAQADELNAKRRQKDARENCPRCEGTNTYTDDDGQTRKCNPHQEAM